MYIRHSIRRKFEYMRATKTREIKAFKYFVCAVALWLCGLWMYHALNIVTIKTDTGKSQVIISPNPEPAALMQEAGIAATKHDKMKITTTVEGTFLDVTTAFTAEVTADGTRHTGKFTGGTVADLLKAANISLGEDDYVLPSPETPLEEGLAASVHRVKYVQEVRREELSQEKLEEYKQTLPDEAQFVESTNGLTYDVLYQDKLVNGLVTQSLVVTLTPIIEAPMPRPQNSFEFLDGVPCSRIESYDDIVFGADGLPTNYTRVMSGAVTTAYSSSGGRGSSGLGLYCGTIAVNPNVIPYGTRVWITDAKQKFVYGFAIATDTGTALMDGRVDIDLYFETNAECRRFGKRQLDVYIFAPEKEE